MNSEEIYQNLMRDAFIRRRMMTDDPNEYAAIDLCNRMPLMADRLCRVTRLSSPVNGLTWAVRLEGLERTVYILPDGDRLRIVSEGTPITTETIQAVVSVLDIHRIGLMKTIELYSRELFRELKRTETT